MSKIHVDEVQLEEFPSLIPLLCEGFPDTSGSYWDSIYARLRLLHRPSELTQIGYRMRADGQNLGVILTYCSEHQHQGTRHLVMNLASWYVKPEYQVVAHLMLRPLLKLEGVSISIYSAISQVVPIFQSKGFHLLQSGISFVPPLLNRRNPSSRSIEEIGSVDSGMFDAHHSRLVADHLQLGCKALRLATRSEHFALLYLPSKVGPLTVARIIYCIDEGVLERFAEQLARFFFRKGFAGFVFESPEKKTLIRSIYHKRDVGKLFRGDWKNVHLDMSYTERVICPRLMGIQ